MLLAAEIGLNYEGSSDLAKEMIRQAKCAGADIAKFQFGWRSGSGDINPIDENRAKEFKCWCDYADIEMMASLITEEGWQLARSLSLNRYKIASRTVIDKPDMVREILDDGKPTLVSLGMWEGDEFPFGPPDGNRLNYIWCKASYPTQPCELKNMPSSFSPDGYYGYSDHFLGIEACLLAIARGAQYVEKHFTLNKTSQSIRDHVLSASPEEFSLLNACGRPLSRLVRANK